jgi:hypothetical protein
MQLRKIITLLVITLVVSASSVLAANDPVSGKYEGIAKSEAIGELPITLEIKNENGKLTGKVESPQGPAPITSGTFADGKITLKLDAGGNELLVTAMLKDNKIVGEWELMGQKGTLELTRAAVAASAPANKEEPKPAAGAAADPVSGEWEAEADAGGQTFPFTLKLKLDGDKVTGASESAMGSAAISKGSFAAEKLTITLDTPNGAIVFTAMVKDGKMTGEFDFAGQGTGKWNAKKK